MKNNGTLPTVRTITALSLLLILSSFKPKCDNKILMDEANKKLKSYTMLRDYPFSFREKKKKDPIEYLKQVVTLNRGVRYKFFAIDNKEYEGRAIVSIYNNEKQEFLLATTFNVRQNKFYEEIEFECKTTGNYCLSFSFQDGLEGCAVGVSSFLK